MLSLLNPFATLTTRQLITHELARARREKLAAESSLEYAHALLAYNTARIERLSTALVNEPEETLIAREPFFARELSHWW
jgi:hypothetical protein